MNKIEFTQDVVMGEKPVTSIEVKPITFLEFEKLWAGISGQSKPEVALQRSRILHQTHFKVGNDRVQPTAPELHSLPASIAKNILASLDLGQGKAGKVTTKGDGVTTPIIYELGQPIVMQSGREGAIEITELEFLASTYGELEDVLATDGEIGKTVALLTHIAAPVGDHKLTRLPGWALDTFPVSDGVSIMRDVLPHF